MQNKMAIYVFIDASNVIYGAKDYGWLVDHKKGIKKGEDSKLESFPNLMLIL